MKFFVSLQCESKRIIINYPFHDVGNNRLYKMEFSFVPLRRGKLMFGFTRTIITFDNELQARSYAKDMKEDYAPYGCTSVKVEILDK